MLLRVEVYSKDWAPDSGNLKNGIAVPTQQFYAWPDDKEGGRLLTVGRKTGTIRLPEDKSVSREHVILRAASSSPKEAASADDANEDDRGLTVFVESVGKLGTFLVQEPPAETVDDSKQDDTKEAGSGTDDETDEEEAIEKSQYQSQSQNVGGVLLSAATRYLLQRNRQNPSKASLQLLDATAAVALKTLDEEAGRVILQCGKLGSTIVLTRVVLLVVVSGMKVTSVSTPRPCDELGLEISNTTHLEKCDLLLTPARNLSFKQVMAWCRNVPIVRAEYLTIWPEKRTPSNLFPDTCQYAPEPDPQHTFWDTPANPTLWSSCTYLSFKAGEAESLAEAAGAKIVQLYKSSSSSPKKVKDDDMYNTAQRLLQSTPHCFGLMDTKHKKLCQRLQELGLPLLPTSSSLTRAIIEQRLPQDANGKSIGRLTSVGNPAPSVITSIDAPSSTASVPTRAFLETKEKSEARETSTSTRSTESADVLPTSSAHRADEPPQHENASKAASVTTRQIDQSETTARERIAQSKKDAIGKEKEDVIPEPDVPSPGHEDEENVSPTTGKEKGPLQTMENAQLRGEKRTASSDSTSPQAKRQKLPTKSGWLQAAPKNKNQRKAYQKSKEEIAQSLGTDVELQQVALTDRCQGLIVVTPDVSSTSSSSTSRRVDSGPDFRKFRKNQIMAPPSRPLAVLRSVLPRETEVQRELEEQREALERQQRRADELFREPAQKSQSRSRR